MTEPEQSTVRKYQLVGPSDSGEVSDLLADLGEKESRHRLQALIAEWLRMENLVVLTGAGTSVSSGGKTMDNLENTVLETVKAMEDLPVGAAAIIEARQNQKEEEKIGFEDWLSFLVNAHHLGAAPCSLFDGIRWNLTTEPSQDDLSSLIDRIGKAIFAECALSLPETSSFAARSADIPPHLSFLAKLVARDSNLGRAHLFTLNYDTLLERFRKVAFGDLTSSYTFTSCMAPYIGKCGLARCAHAIPTCSLSKAIFRLMILRRRLTGWSNLQDPFQP